MKCSESRYSRCMYFASGALARKIEKLAMACWKKAALSPSHGYLLVIALEQPGIQPGQLAAQLQLSPSTVTRLVEKLEEKELVRRSMEGKTTNIFPTEKGRALSPMLESCIRQFHEQVENIVGQDNASQLIESIHRCTDTLDD